MESPPPQKPSLLNRVVRAVLGGIPGVLLGLVVFYVLQPGLGLSLFLGVLATFVGAALAQPDVSKTNVLTGTATMVVVHNTPRALRQEVADAMMGPPPPSPPPSASSSLQFPQAAPPPSRPPHS